MTNYQPVGVPTADIGERQHDLLYSTLIVIIDLVWYTIFVTFIIVILYSSQNEVTALPLRTWLVVYGATCMLQMVFAVVQNSIRRRKMRSSGLGSKFNSSSRVDAADSWDSVAMFLFAINIGLPPTWWIFGFFAVIFEVFGKLATDLEAPKLIWSIVAFLAIDVLTVVICTAVYRISGTVVCSCLPCVIAILYVGRSGRSYKREIETGEIAILVSPESQPK